MHELDEFRKSKDQFFARHPQSPLTHEQQRKFTGLSYFDHNSSLDLKVRVEEDPEQGEVIMQTSTGDAQHYKRYGTFKFSVGGEEAELTIYASHHGFFLPFVDGQANEATYGAGRYLDPVLLHDGRFHVDFNLAYNPYCAYNQLYSCPLTPFENRVKVAVKAGEKLPEGDWVEHV